MIIPLVFCFAIRLKFSFPFFSCLILNILGNFMTLLKYFIGLVILVVALRCTATLYNLSQYYQVILLYFYDMGILHWYILPFFSLSLCDIFVLCIISTYVTNLRMSYIFPWTVNHILNSLKIRKNILYKILPLQMYFVCAHSEFHFNDITDCLKDFFSISSEISCWINDIYFHVCIFGKSLFPYKS